MSYDEMLSTFAVKVNSRHYMEAMKKAARMKEYEKMMKDPDAIAKRKEEGLKFRKYEARQIESEAKR